MLKLLLKQITYVNVHIRLSRVYKLWLEIIRKLNVAVKFHSLIQIVPILRLAIAFERKKRKLCFSLISKGESYLKFPRKKIQSANII